MDNCVLLTCLYVGAVRLSNGRSGGNRDDRHIIVRRSIAVFTVCAVSWLPTARTCASHSSLVAALGLRSDGVLPAVATTLGLCSSLFASPLLILTCESISGSETVLAKRKYETRLVLVRNLVVAPLAEEFVFRACMVQLLFLSPPFPTWPVFSVHCCAPACFAAAHVHHAWRRGLPGAQRNMLANTLFQFVYTFLFGAFATALLCRTGTLAAPIAAHVFCNAMGVPSFQRLWGEAPAAFVWGVVVFSSCLHFYLRGEWRLPIADV